MEALRQWLLACNGVNHSLDEHAHEICQYPEHCWRDEEHSRLHQLAGALAFLSRPEPLLGQVLAQVNARPPSQIGERSKAVALYGLQAVRLLTERGALPCTTKLHAPLAGSLDYWLERKAGQVRRTSQLEATLGAALAQSGLAPVQDVTIGHGLSADFRCMANSTVGARGLFFLEVDGPSHFCVRPHTRPRGRTVLKRRLFEALGHRLVSIPYWHFGPQGSGAAAFRPHAHAGAPGICVEDVQALVAAQLAERALS